MESKYKRNAKETTGHTDYHNMLFAGMVHPQVHWPHPAMCPMATVLAH
jgi:hypothetical protein